MVFGVGRISNLVTFDSIAMCKLCIVLYGAQVNACKSSELKWNASKRNFITNTILTPSKIFTPSRNSSPPRPHIAAELLLSLDKYGRSKPST